MLKDNDICRMLRRIQASVGDMEIMRAAAERIEELLKAQTAAHYAGQVNYDKTKLNTFVQEEWDRRWQEGKHGHYETLFGVVHAAIRQIAAAPQPGHVRDAAQMVQEPEQSKNKSQFIKVNLSDLKLSHTVSGGGQSAAATQEPAQANVQPAMSDTMRTLIVEGQELDGEEQEPAQTDTTCQSCSGHGASLDGSRDCVRCNGTGEPKPAQADAQALLHAESSLQEFEHFAAKLCKEGKLNWAGFREDADGKYTIPVISPAEDKLIRAILEVTYPSSAQTDAQAVATLILGGIDCLHNGQLVVTLSPRPESRGEQMSTLRPCTVGIYKWSTEHRKNALFEVKPALFHEWGLDVIESESGNASYSVAIVEFADGCVEVHPPYAIQFTDRKAEVSK